MSAKFLILRERKFLVPRHQPQRGIIHFGTPGEKDEADRSFIVGPSVGEGRVNDTCRYATAYRGAQKIRGKKKNLVTLRLVT